MMSRKINTCFYIHVYKVVYLQKRHIGSYDVHFSERHPSVEDWDETPMVVNVHFIP